MNIEDVKGEVSFEETDYGVKVFVEFTHPTKTSKFSGVEFPLKGSMWFEYQKGSNEYLFIERFFSNET